ncbi:rho gtpase activation protein [Anaeramoeba flamelloides]|uniref:Rho gtpase activation protein n=1 Tax=Anaeramoeba flamelloides TaxID=1746091 RepID=A0ABQ8Y9F7_9EUKA|nr:rho gtpase activation protein [Anaeramoeba flamelloides]
MSIVESPSTSLLSSELDSCYGASGLDDSFSFESPKIHNTEEMNCNQKEKVKSKTIEKMEKVQQEGTKNRHKKRKKKIKKTNTMGNTKMVNKKEENKDEVKYYQDLSKQFSQKLIVIDKQDILESDRSTSLDLEEYLTLGTQEMKSLGLISFQRKPIKKRTRKKIQFQTKRKSQSFAFGNTYRGQQKFDQFSKINEPDTKQDGNTDFQLRKIQDIIANPLDLEKEMEKVKTKRKKFKKWLSDNKDKESRGKEDERGRRNRPFINFIRIEKSQQKNKHKQKRKFKYSRFTTTSKPIEGFAKQYLPNEHEKKSKKGLLRKKPQSFQSQLSYSPNGLQSPLLLFPSEKENKKAIKLFEYLLFFMGEKKYVKKLTKKLKKKKKKKKTTISLTFEQNEAVKKIIRAGLKNKNMRDEIYLQISKQTINNENPNSNIRAWGALCLITESFPPSVQVKEYIHKIFDHFIQTDGGYIKRYAEYAQMKLKAISKKKSGFSIPSDNKIRRIYAVPFDPIVFNVTLEQCMQIQQKFYPNEIIPHILIFLIEKIKQNGGLQSEGLFRVPGNAKKIAELQDMLDKGDYEITDKEMNHPFVFASTLKLWLRELNQPIIPFKYVEQIINIKITNIDEIIQIAEKLPKLNQYSLAYLINFFKQLLNHKTIQKTKMDLQNLVLMFAPNLVRCENTKDLQFLVKLTKQRNVFLQVLIQKWDLQGIIDEIFLVDTSNDY